MNWRSPILRTVHRVDLPGTLSNYRQVKSFEEKGKYHVERNQTAKLIDLLEHAYETVPYYREVLGDAGVVIDGNVDLTAFTDVPPLTKDRLREHHEELQSIEPGSGVFENTSGGTTGEPVEFLQDDGYLRWNRANKLYFHDLAGRSLGEPWIQLWGDESVTLDERKGLRERIADWIRNRHVLNSFQMDEDQMDTYVRQINHIQPRSIEAYVESIEELANHIIRKELDVYSPNGILSTAGTLHPPVRERVEQAFGAPVLNKYGSREVGDIACECTQQDGLHVFSHTHYVEVIDEDGNPVPPGEEGELAITLLTNYTMPLIRYRIGDMGIKSERQCSCGRPFPLLEKVTGRVSDHLQSIDGGLVHGEFFTHLLYHKPWVKKFQVRQTALDQVVYRIVTEDEEPPERDLKEIKTKTENVLGEEVVVAFDFCESIESSASGKYRYTISEVTNE